MDRVVVKNTFIHDFADTSESPCVCPKPRSKSVPAPACRQSFHDSPPSSPEESDAGTDSEEMLRGKYDRVPYVSTDESTTPGESPWESPRSTSSRTQVVASQVFEHRTATDSKRGKKGAGKGNNKGAGKGSKNGGKHQCWILIGIEDDRKFGVRQRIISKCKRIAELSFGAKLRLRGRGSKFEEEDGKEADCDLMLCISCNDCDGYKMVLGAFCKLLSDIHRQYYSFCRVEGPACPHLEVMVNPGRRPEGRRPGPRPGSR